MTSLKEVKEEIDNNANGKIDTQEMVDFLKDEKREENFQKLRDGLDEELRFNVEETDSDWNTFIEKEKNYKLIEEFETAMKEICWKIIEMKENVTPNQFRILLFYLEYFWPEIEEQWDEKMEKIEEEIKKLEEEKAKLKNELEEIKKQKTALINELQSSIWDEKKEKEKKLKNLEKDENNISKKLEKTERTLKNKRFNQKYGEAYERLNLIKEEDKVYYEVWMFVVNYQKKYYQEMSKRQQDRKRYKNSHLKKHEKSLNKNPFYWFVEVEDAQRQEKKMDEFNRETEKIIILTYTKEKKSEFINLVVNKYNKDKKAVEEILNKEILSDKDKQTLFYFLDYYKDLHNTYTTEEWLKGKYPIAKIDENLPLLTLTNGLATTWYSINKTLMNYKNYYRSILSEIISEDEIIWREDMYLEDPEEKDKDNKMPIRSIIRWRLTLYTEENINIDEIFYDQIARKIDRKLYPSEFNLIQNFTEKWTNLNNKEIDVYDIKTINDRYKKHWKNHPDLAKEVENQTEKIIKNITEKKLKNNNDGSNPINNLSVNDIWAFQLWANIEYWEDLKIDGKREQLSKKDSNTPWEITNLYIYRQRLTVRESENYKHIIRIPNINDILDKLDTKEKQHKVLKSFLRFLFEIEKNWIKYEDKIWWDVFSVLFDNMISSELYKGKKAEDEIREWEELKQQVEPLVNLGIWDEISTTDWNENFQTFSEIYKYCEKMINWLKELQSKWISDLWEYYQKATTTLHWQIDEQNRNNILQDQINANITTLNKKINTIISQLNNLPKLNIPTRNEYNTTNPSSPHSFQNTKQESYEDMCIRIKNEYDIAYKTYFKTIAINFINILSSNEIKFLEQNDKNGPYINESLSIQIFMEIYRLRKHDGIAKEFGKNGKFVENKCNYYRNIVNSVSNLKEQEEIVDITTQIQEINKCIENGQLVWSESHEYNTESGVEYRDYTVPTDAIDQTIRVSTGKENPKSQRPGLIWYEKISYIDTYQWPWYSEQHVTYVAIHYKDWKVRTLHSAPKAWERLIQPNPNGWYAILPDDMKNKCNQWKIKLGIIDGKACVYEFDSQQKIKVYQFNTKTRKLDTKPYKIITVEEYKKALSIAEAHQNTRETDHWEEFNKIKDELNAIMIWSNISADLINKRNNKNLDDFDLKRLQELSVNLYNRTVHFSNNRKKLEALRESLNGINKNSNNYINPYEKQVNELIQNINKILEFTTLDNIKKAEKFRDRCLKNIESNDARRKTWKERWPEILGFIAAIGIMIASRWSLSFVSLSLMSAATGIATKEISRIGLNRVDKHMWWGSIEVNGVKYETHYINPTLIEEARDDKKTRGECVALYGIEFIQSAGLQMLFMWLWKVASPRLLKLLQKAPKGSFAEKCSNWLIKMVNKEFSNTDPYTQWIIKSTQKQLWREWFVTRLSKEVLEESREESIENIAEQEWWLALWLLATFIHCLKPHPWQELQLAWVWHPNISTNEGKIISETTYDSKNPENLTLLKEYYAKTDWYDVEVKGNILKVTAHGVKTEEGESIITKDVEMIFRPSKASLEIRNIPTPLKAIGSIFVNEETWVALYGSNTQMRLLWKYLESQWLWRVKINENWTATLTIGKDQIELKQDKTYINEKQHKYNIKPEQVSWNSTFMDKLSTDIEFDAEKSQKTLEKLLERINEQYTEITKNKEGLNLNEKQLLAIIKAHEQKGELWNLSQNEILNKHRILTEAWIENNIVRFLFEAGFCGKRSDTNTLQQNNNEEENEIDNNEIQMIEITEDEREIMDEEEIRRIANIFSEFIPSLNVDEYVDRMATIPMAWKNEQYIRNVLSCIRDNINNNWTTDELNFYINNAIIIDNITNNSNITIENIENVLQDKRININDIEYAVRQNNNISMEELIQEIKKFNILLNIESEEDLQNYLTKTKKWSEITWNLDEYISRNSLSKHAEDIKNRYYGNFNSETQRFTMARDIWETEYDRRLIQNIINQQNIKPRWLETNSLYDLLIQLHNESHDRFVLYSRYLQWEDITALAWEYSIWSTWWYDKDLTLFRHTKIWGEYQRVGKETRYRIIWEFASWEIVRSWSLDQVTDKTANRGESERITLWEVSCNNIVQIIDLETGKPIYDRNTWYISPEFQNNQNEWTLIQQDDNQSNNNWTRNNNQILDKNNNEDSNRNNETQDIWDINQLEDAAISNIAQIRLNTICSEKITLNKSWLKEEEINQLFKNLGTIKEITWKEKFSLNELQELIKYSENELKTIKLIKLKFWKYIESLDNISDWLHFRYMKKDVFNALNDSTIREKLEQISWKNKWSLSNLRSLSETRDLNNLLNTISDPEIRQKLENLNWWRKILIAELPALSDIKDLKTKLDNITNNLDKIKELTKENRLDIKYLDYYNLLTNITKDDLDKIASITKQDPLEIIKYISNSAISWENSEGVRANYTKLELINDNIFKMSREGWVDYIIINEYGKITLQDIWNNTFIYHAWMHPKWPSPSQKEIMRVSVLAWRAFLNLADIIPEWHKITETLSLSWDSFPLFLKEYQNDFHNNYTVRATGKMIYLNSQWILSPLSKLINKKCIREDAEIFEAATQTDAQEVADAINDLMKDRWMPLSEWQTITELAQAQVEYCEETWLWRVKIPQIEITKEYNNGVELSQQLNKCTTYNEMENILLANLSTEYHFRDGTLTWRDLLNRFSSYRDTYINWWDAFPKDIDPRRFFPAELIEPAKWKSEWTPTRRNTTRKSNIHILLDSK